MLGYVVQGDAFHVVRVYVLHHLLDGIRMLGIRHSKHHTGEAGQYAREPDTEVIQRLKADDLGQKIAREAKYTARLRAAIDRRPREQYQKLRHPRFNRRKIRACRKEDRAQNLVQSALRAGLVARSDIPLQPFFGFNADILTVAPPF